MAKQEKEGKNFITAIFDFSFSDLNIRLRYIVSESIYRLNSMPFSSPNFSQIFFGNSITPLSESFIFSTGITSDMIFYHNKYGFL